MFEEMLTRTLEEPETGPVLGFTLEAEDTGQPEPPKFRPLMLKFGSPRGSSGVAIAVDASNRRTALYCILDVFVGETRRVKRLRMEDIRNERYTWRVVMFELNWAREWILSSPFMPPEYPRCKWVDNLG